MSATLPHDPGAYPDDVEYSTHLSSGRTRLWRVIAMVAPLAALVIGMLMVVGAMG